MDTPHSFRLFFTLSKIPLKTELNSSSKRQLNQLKPQRYHHHDQTSPYMITSHKTVQPATITTIHSIATITVRPPPSTTKLLIFWPRCHQPHHLHHQPIDHKTYAKFLITKNAMQLWLVSSFWNQKVGNTMKWNLT